MKSIYRAPMPGVGATFSIADVTAIAKPSPAVKEGKVRRRSHKASLQRKEGQARTGRAKLKADKT